eukprot:760159-Hanusia_phi.AAC.2
MVCKRGFTGVPNPSSISCGNYSCKSSCFFDANNLDAYKMVRNEMKLSDSADDYCSKKPKFPGPRKAKND